MKSEITVFAINDRVGLLVEEILASALHKTDWEIQLAPRAQWHSYQLKKTLVAVIDRDLLHSGAAPIEKLLANSAVLITFSGNDLSNVLDMVPALLKSNLVELQDPVDISAS